MIILGICHFIPDKAFFFSSLVLNLLCLKSDSSHKVQHDVRVNFFLSSIGWQDVNFSLGSLVGFFRKVIFLSPYSPPPSAKLKNLSFWSSCHRARHYNMGRGPGVDLRGFLFSDLSKGNKLGFYHTGRFIRINGTYALYLKTILFWWLFGGLV